MVDFPWLSIVIRYFPECSLKRNMINSHIKGQVNFGSSQSMPNESKYTHFSAPRIPTQRKNKMLWKTCPTPFQNWLVRLNFIGDASLVIPCISGTIIRSWWNMVKSYPVVSIFFLLGTLLVASRDFFLGIRQAMPLSVTKTLAFPRMNSVAGVRFGIQFVQYGYLPGKFKIDTHKKCRRFFRCVYSCPKMRCILGICENQISGVHCFSSSFRKGYERWTTFSEMLDLGPMKSDIFFSKATRLELPIPLF